MLYKEQSHSLSTLEARALAPRLSSTLLGVPCWHFSSVYPIWVPFLQSPPPAYTCVPYLSVRVVNRSVVSPVRSVTLIKCRQLSLSDKETSKSVPHHAVGQRSRQREETASHAAAASSRFHHTPRKRTLAAVKGAPVRPGASNRKSDPPRYGSLAGSKANPFRVATL